MEADQQKDTTPFPREVLELLRCPSTGRALDYADAALLAQVAERLRVDRYSSGGHASTASTEIKAGLVRSDRELLFPIRHGIPVLLMEEAISL